MGRSSDLFTTYPMIKFFLFDLYQLFEITKTHGEKPGKPLKNSGSTPLDIMPVWDLLSGSMGSPGGLLLGLALDVTFHGASRWSPPWWI